MSYARKAPESLGSMPVHALLKKLIKAEEERMLRESASEIWED